MKLVINICFGGFSISEAALHALAERKSLTLYPRTDEEYGHYTEHFTTPTFEEDSYFSERPEDRSDPDLIAVVEELGEAAWGDHSELLVVDIPCGTQYRIWDYDGKETVQTPGNITWQIAR